MCYKLKAEKELVGKEVIEMKTNYLRKNLDFKNCRLVVLLVVVILSFQVHAQNSSAGIITHKNPSVEAMRLRGDVSCMKIYRTPLI